MGKEKAGNVIGMKCIPAAWIVWCLIGMSIVSGGCAGRSQAPSAEGKVFLHRVEDGETLEQVAEDYYGDPDRAGDLEEFNDLSGKPLPPGSFIHVPLTRMELQALRRREEARTPYNQGLELAARGAYVDAVMKFQAALAIDPDFIDARYNLGVTYQNMKAYDRALVQYKELARLRRRNPAYLFAAGYCLFHMEHHRKAVKWFEKALAIDPDHARAQYSLAVAYERMGNDTEAIRAWRRYLEIDSESEWAMEARKRLEKLEQ